MPQTFAEKLIHFYQSLQPPKNLPEGIDVLFPQQNKEVMKLVKIFFTKFYNDNKPRRLMFGINPGRFGAGTTGVNFTGPRQLKEFCGIDHHFKNHSELSAEFIYEMIHQYGGVKKFYSEWFITAVCPLGFVRSFPPPKEGAGWRFSPSGGGVPIKSGRGRNLNYYDDKELLQAVNPFIIESIQKQVDMGFKKDFCICVGGEKNFKFFSQLNEKNKWFKKIIPLPHPRFIMQYRRRYVETFIKDYLSALKPSKKI